MTPRRFAFLLGSARADGATEWLARRAAESLDPATTQTWLRLKDLPLPRFEDLRHPTPAFPPPQGPEKLLFDSTVDASDLVFVAPVYWYSLPSLLKHYLDYWSAWMRVPDAHFKSRMAGKSLWLVTTSTGNVEEFEPMRMSVAMSAEYMQMNFRGALLCNASRPDDIFDDREAMVRASRFFD